MNTANSDDNFISRHTQNLSKLEGDIEFLNQQQWTVDSVIMSPSFFGLIRQESDFLDLWIGPRSYTKPTVRIEVDYSLKGEIYFLKGVELKRQVNLTLQSFREGFKDGKETSKS